MVSDSGNGGNWRIVVALIGCLILSAVGLWDSQQRLNNADEQRYQSYRYAADKPLDVDPAAPVVPPQTFEYRKPCEGPKGKDESNLCAQWRAAKAAENSAFWAKWSFWVGIGGMVGLFWTLYYTREAVKDTGEATKAMLRQNELAEDTAKKQLRAYVDICDEKTGIERQPHRDQDGNIAAKITRGVRNYGQTPAKNARWFNTHMVVRNPLEDIRLVDNPALEWQAAFDIPPGGQMAMPIQATFVPEIYDHIIDQTSSMVVIVFVAYEDVYGQSHQAKYAMAATGHQFEDGEFAVIANTFTAT